MTPMHVTTDTDEYGTEISTEASIQMDPCCCPPVVSPNEPGDSYECQACGRVWVARLEWTSTFQTTGLVL